jgi:hypothetical protein
VKSGTLAQAHRSFYFQLLTLIKEDLMTTQAQKQAVGIGKYVQAGLIGGILAGVVNIILYTLGQTLNGSPMMVIPPGQAGEMPLPFFMVTIMSVVPGIVAGLLYGVLARFTARPKLIFLIIAAVVFIVMFLNPFMAAQGITTIIVLELMHLVVAGFVIWRILGVARN